MIAIPNTTIAILGGSSNSDFEDPVEGTTVVTSGLPAFIMESRKIVATESDPQARAIRYYTGRVPFGTEVVDSQRIRDEITGETFVIDHVSLPRNGIIPQDVRLDLRRVE